MDKTSNISKKTIPERQKIKFVNELFMARKTNNKGIEFVMTFLGEE
jgi:hypothetical protein